MNIGNIKIFLSVLKSTQNILSVTKQSKALLYMDNPYSHSRTIPLLPTTFYHHPHSLPAPHSPFLPVPIFTWIPLSHFAMAGGRGGASIWSRSRQTRLWEKSAKFFGHLFAKQHSLVRSTINIDRLPKKWGKNSGVHVRLPKISFLFLSVQVFGGHGMLDIFDGGSSFIRHFGIRSLHIYSEPNANVHHPLRQRQESQIHFR